MGSGPGETDKRPPEVTAAATERIPAGEAGEGADFAGELLSMEDIYRAAGIVGPRRAGATASTKWGKCCTANTFGDWSEEMKRASVLMALDAAGVSIDEVVLDAKARQGAIDICQASYWDGEAKSFERPDLRAS